MLCFIRDFPISCCHAFSNITSSACTYPSNKELGSNGMRDKSIHSWGVSWSKCYKRTTFVVIHSIRSAYHNMGMERSCMSMSCFVSPVLLTTLLRVMCKFYANFFGVNQICIVVMCSRNVSSSKHECSQWEQFRLWISCLMSFSLRRPVSYLKKDRKMVPLTSKYQLTGPAWRKFTHDTCPSLPWAIGIEKDTQKEISLCRVPSHHNPIETLDVSLTGQLFGFAT